MASENEKPDRFMCIMPKSPGQRLRNNNPARLGTADDTLFMAADRLLAGTDDSFQLPVEKTLSPDGLIQGIALEDDEYAYYAPTMDAVVEYKKLFIDAANATPGAVQDDGFMNAQARVDVALQVAATQPELCLLICTAFALREAGARAGYSPTSDDYTDYFNARVAMAHAATTSDPEILFAWDETDGFALMSNTAKNPKGIMAKMLSKNR